MTVLDEARKFFIDRRLFISTNYDDDFYRLLPMLIMLKADLDQPPHTKGLPNLCVYAPFPRKIEKFLGSSLTAEDWHVALKRGWVHVISRKNFFERSWRDSGDVWFKEYYPAYDDITRLEKHHTLLPDDYFEWTIGAAERTHKDILSKHGPTTFREFAEFLATLDRVSGASAHFRGAFAEIRDRTLGQDGYDGERAAIMLFRYFLNDFHQARAFEFADILIPPVYVDLARHIMGASGSAVRSEPSPVSLLADTDIRKHILDREEKLRNSAFIESAVEALSVLAEIGSSAASLSSGAPLETRVEFFARYYREGVWLLIWLLAKLSSYTLAGVTLNPTTYNWREKMFVSWLRQSFGYVKQARWTIGCLEILSQIPAADRFGLLRILNTFARRYSVRHLSPNRTLIDVLGRTGAFLGGQKSSVSDRAKRIWSMLVNRSSQTELSLILDSSDEWANFFVGMEQVRLLRLQSAVQRSYLWRALTSH
jgi:hypothetical protein